MCFKNYPMARYETGVTFQTAFRPSSSVAERQNIILGNINFMVIKIEVAVSSNGS